MTNSEKAEYVNRCIDQINARIADMDAAMIRMWLSTKPKTRAVVARMVAVGAGNSTEVDDDFMFYFEGSLAELEAEVS